MGITFKDLYENKECRKLIPRESGVYCVKVPDGMEVKFKKIPDGTQKTHNSGDLDNIYDKVVEKWNTLIQNNADTTILYYGKAKNLRTRIMQYVRFGYNEVDNHAGGRAIWYIEDNKILEVEFHVTSDYENEEARLINEYENMYNSKPLANINKGRTKLF